MKNDNENNSVLTPVQNASASICTLGCRVNQYESRAIEEALESRGFTIKDFDDICDVYIINTCAVTAESERKSRQMARRAAKRNPNASILMTGCQAQLHPEDCKRIAGVRYVGGNSSKLEIADVAVKLINDSRELVYNTRDIDGIYENYRVLKPDHTRAYIKIEDGCKNKCAYCVIPKVRGPVRSKPFEDALAEVKAVAEKGYREIVFTGIEVCDYQYDLCGLIAAAAEIDGIERIRLASVNPAFINKAFADRVKNVKKFCPHFHLSLQSCCDRTLREMRRPYNTEILKRNVSYIRSVIPNVTFTADMICGFPGESDGDFSETLKNFGELGVIFAHIFPYSPRPETEAASMPDQVDEAVKNSRCTRLAELRDDVRKRMISELVEQKKEYSVLFEETRRGYWFGHTENFIEVCVKSREVLGGKIRAVRLLGESGIGNTWLAELI